MAQFILLLYADNKPWMTMNRVEQQKWFDKYMAWGKKASEGGYLVGGQKLVDDDGQGDSWAEVAGYGWSVR